LKRRGARVLLLKKLAVISAAAAVASAVILSARLLLLLYFCSFLLLLPRAKEADEKTRSLLAPPLRLAYSPSRPNEFVRRTQILLALLKEQTNYRQVAPDQNARASKTFKVSRLPRAVPK